MNSLAGVGHFRAYFSFLLRFQVFVLVRSMPLPFRQDNIPSSKEKNSFIGVGRTFTHLHCHTSPPTLPLFLFSSLPTNTPFCRGRMVVPGIRWRRSGSFLRGAPSSRELLFVWYGDCGSPCPHQPALPTLLSLYTPLGTSADNASLCLFWRRGLLPFKRAARAHAHTTPHTRHLRAAPHTRCAHARAHTHIALPAPLHAHTPPFTRHRTPDILWG